MRRQELGQSFSDLVDTDALEWNSDTLCWSQISLMLRKFLLTDKYVFSEVQEEILSKLRLNYLVFGIWY